MAFHLDTERGGGASAGEKDREQRKIGGFKKKDYMESMGGHKIEVQKDRISRERERERERKIEMKRDRDRERERERENG